MESPRIYVASLADYNAGRLLGRWIDLTQGEEHVHAEIKAMLAESREMVAEEWAIHDFEGFGRVGLGEYTDIGTVLELADLIREHGSVFPALVEYVGGIDNLAEAERYMQEGYCGEFASVRDYVEDMLDDCYGDAIGRLPDFIRYHIDYSGIAHDLECGGDIFTLEVAHSVHVFNSNT